MSSGVKRPAMRGPTAGVAFTVSIVYDDNVTDVHNEHISLLTSVRGLFVASFGGRRLSS